MKVTINEDETTATCSEGKQYKIRGVMIIKPKSKGNAFYSIGTNFCKAICCKGHTHESIINENGTIDLI